MFDYLKGTLVELSPQKATLDVNGIGYLILIPVSIYTNGLLLGNTTTFYTSFIVREDSQRLFGFLTKEERDLFETLSNVSGIGPKTALNIIGHIEHHNLQDAIYSANTTRLSKIPGIGKKTAERLIVELKDKIQTLTTDKPRPSSLASDAISALVNLGYNQNQAEKAIEKVMKESEKELALSSLITSALRNV